jgi:plastocyanin
MKKSNIVAIIIILVVIVGGVIALSGSKSKTSDHAAMTPNPKTAAEKPSDPNTVFISNYMFNPTPLKVKKGTRVTWTNHDIAKHNIVVDGGMPAGGPDSQVFGKNESFSFTFDTVGIYKYHCAPHPYMHGVVEVTE